MQKTKDALLEIGTEHLPARFIASTLEQIRTRTRKILAEKSLKCKDIQTLGTPRRLTLILLGLEEYSEPMIQYAYGPKASLLKDNQGNYTPQAIGFAKAQGISVEELEVKATSKGELLATKKSQPGISALKIPPNLFLSILSSLTFPKKMEWEETHIQFVRPVRNLLALYGKKKILFEWAGVKSGTKALGVLSTGNKTISIPEVSRYLTLLKNRCLLIDPEQRKEAIIQGLDQTVKKFGYHWLKDPELIHEITFLTEYPTPLLGQYSLKFLKLPRQLLLTVLKKQLKLFPVLDAQNQIQPYFAGIRDGISEGQKEVQEGYERVVEARFSDAAFFIEKDHRIPLTGMREKLKKVTYHSSLGTMYQKSERVIALTAELCDHLDKANNIDSSLAKQIAELCYADLVSEVVKEFPELQGTMGGEHARLSGLSEAIAHGIQDFYKPTASGNDLPQDTEAAIVSLAGKLDSIVGNYVVGNIPSGSEDPYALKRQGTGIIRIVLEKNIPINLKQATAKAHELVLENLSGDATQEQKEATGAVWFFLWDRAQTYFEEKGYTFDEIEAINTFDENDPTPQEYPIENLLKTYRKLRALHDIRKQPEFNSLVLIFKRASNILKQNNYIPNGSNSNPQLFCEEAERTLHENLEKVRALVSNKLQEEEFIESLKIMVALKEPLDDFFNKVMVVVEDKDLKENRLKLLHNLVGLFKSIADLSKLQA
ncbi:MAG: glycine--tRNA ligase subunit beta [Elusimicrobia bacterium]|nr:glycine--tRNA ligase subunit beta [Elusimicrobiota bacterium]